MRKTRNTLKVIFLMMCVLYFGLLAGTALATDVTYDLTLEWEQLAIELPQMVDGGGWKLYSSLTSGGPYIPVLDVNGQQIFVAYDGSAGPTFTTDQSFIITGPPGSSVTTYYVLTAVPTDLDQSVESDFSNEALNPDGTTGVVVEIPKVPMSVPANVKVTLIVRPQ